MTYIEPTSELTLLKGIPLNPDYANTTHYDTASAQYADIVNSKYSPISLKNYTYLRTNAGTIRIEAKYEDVYNYNYLVFRNKNFENKYWYAFITGASYISNEVTDIYFTIDVMQSYMFDYTLEQSYIERQHASSDVWYENTQPENVECGSGYYQGSAYGTISWKWWYTVVATQGPNGEQAVARIQNGIPCGVTVSSFDNTTDFINWVQKYIDNGYEDSIINMYMGPALYSAKGETITFKNEYLGAYKPRNKKLFQYPYRVLELMNNLGTSLEFRPEYFTVKDENGFTFRYNRISEVYPSATAVVYPTDYGPGDGYEYAITYSVFPTIAFAGDSYKAWWAQNKNSYVASLNAITGNYDTAISTSNLNLTAAKNSAYNSYSQTINSANNAVTQAENSYNTATQNAQSAYDLSTQNLSTSIQQDVSNAGNSILTWFRSTGGGNDPSGHLTERRNQQAMESSAASLNNTLNSTTVQAQTTLKAANLSAQTALQNAQSGAQVATLNALNAYNTAIKNATLSQEAEQLSAFTTKNNAIASLNAKKQDMMHQPNSIKGQAACDGINAHPDLEKMHFTYQLKTITSEYAERIDRYFDLYGYAQNKLYKPTILNRKYWSYLKTVGCNITGDLSKSDLNIIASIYDNGITTWNSLSNIYNYDLDNTI
jgi:hypothetical protein